MDTKEASQIVADCAEESIKAPMRAGINLTKALDSAFARGDVAFVEDVLRHLDPQRVHGDTMVIVLSYVWRASKARGTPKTYDALVDRLLDALGPVWGWSEEDVEDAQDTLGRS